MAERLNAAVLKTVGPARVPRVRIPLSPPSLSSPWSLASRAPSGGARDSNPQGAELRERREPFPSAAREPRERRSGPAARPPGHPSLSAIAFQPLVPRLPGPLRRGAGFEPAGRGAEGTARAVSQRSARAARAAKRAGGEAAGTSLHRTSRRFLRKWVRLGRRYAKSVAKISPSSPFRAGWARVMPSRQAKSPHPGISYHYAR